MTLVFDCLFISIFFLLASLCWPLMFMLPPVASVMFLVVDLVLFRNLCEGRVLCVSTPDGCFTDRMLSIGAGAGGGCCV